MTAVLVGLTLLGMGLLPPPREEPAPRTQPAAEAKTETPARPNVQGRASWYAYHEGQAAAGPQLRKMLGKDWRGQRVSVCIQHSDSCITVTLTDWCQCYRGEKRERVIDLDSRDFAKLAPTSAGLTRVRVSAG